MFAGAINDNAGHIISSPFFRSRLNIDKCSAVVQLEVTRQYFILKNFFKLSSNFKTNLPWLDIQPLFKHSTTFFLALEDNCVSNIGIID
tara:strand:+ start:98 stop:364 length:267 start_codon:yes stop_codon:yes gene_type:complete